MIVICVRALSYGQRFIYVWTVCVFSGDVAVLVVLHDDVLAIVNIIGRSRTNFRACTIRAYLILNDGLGDSSAEGIIGKGKLFDVGSLCDLHSG